MKSSSPRDVAASFPDFLRCTGTAPRQTHSRHLPPTELADRILQIQRTAAHRHLSVQEWRTLDRMRRRNAALQKELMSRTATASVANDRRLLYGAAQWT